MYPLLVSAKQAEKMPVVIFERYSDMCKKAAAMIAELVRGKPNAVLGLATGSTPIGVYRELIRMQREEGLDFSAVTFFNLDEYYPIRRESIQSFYRFMKENFFNYIEAREEQIHVPDGTLREEAVEAYCEQFERAIRDAGGIDLQILGIGRNGHIGFNEPGSRIDSRTRVVWLDHETRVDAAADFFGIQHVPLKAITMGVGTILEARNILLMAMGEQKAPIIKKAVEGDVTEKVPASYLQTHPNATVFLEMASASELTRVKTPWLVQEVRWNDPKKIESAIVWLCQKTGKKILELTEDDYRANGLKSLIAERNNNAREIGHLVYKRLESKILAKSELPSGRDVLVFSPHPDDDVICLAITIKNLIENHNRVTIAYMVSGALAVRDEQVLDHLKQRDPRIMRYIQSLPPREHETAQQKFYRIVNEIKAFFIEKEKGDVDIPLVQEIKRIIREQEAKGVCRVLEATPVFLNLPFYKTGRVRKDPIGEEDVKRVLNVLKKVKPSIVYIPGELTDPHGTHGMCVDAFDQALKRYRQTTQYSLKPIRKVIKYKGAWEEYPVHEAQVIVPFNRREMENKINLIMDHISQLNPLFPGPYDDREFWERARDRNIATIRCLRNLGLPTEGYYAAEVFTEQRIK